jgi:cytochrome c peroxidase
VNPEQAALGRLLFYDPIASVDKQTACATCHSEVWGMTDGLPLSIGNGGGLFSGPGRIGSNLTRRNAPTLWNVAYGTAFFWDGRASSLEDQVHFPFAAAEELDRSYTDVVADVAAIPGYQSLFAAAFPGETPAVTEDTFARAVAAFERTVLSSRGLYDAYLDGDTRALSEESLRGMSLLAEAGCVNCHVPPLFTSDRFEDRGVPAIDGIIDDGRAEITLDEADSRKFKVPTLRNLSESGPYFHTGQTALLRDAVAHEASRSAEVDGARALGDDELDAITTFITKALFDRRHNPTRPREVPSGLPIPIDGFDLRR